MMHLPAVCSETMSQGELGLLCWEPVSPDQQLTCRFRGTVDGTATLATVKSKIISRAVVINFSKWCAGKIRKGTSCSSEIRSPGSLKT